MVFAKRPWRVERERRDGMLRAVAASSVCQDMKKPPELVRRLWFHGGR